MAFVFVLVILALIGLGAMLAAGHFGELPEADRDGRPASSGFDIVARGYRMDEVDARIASLEAELAEARKTP